MSSDVVSDVSMIGQRLNAYEFSAYRKSRKRFWWAFRTHSEY